MIVKTEAIVLRKTEYSESSLIASLFTRTNGVVSVIAKGARKPKSKFAACLVPGQVLEVVFYNKQSRSVQTLSDVSFLLKLETLSQDVTKMALAVTTVELVAQVMHENERNEPLFLFLIKLLNWINTRDQVSRIYFPYIQTRIIEYIGIGLQPEANSGTKQVVKGYINIASGTLSELSEGNESQQLTPAQFSFLNHALKSNKVSFFEKNLSKSELSALIEYLDKYIRYHVEGVKPRKSDGIFEQILNQ